MAGATLTVADINATLRGVPPANTEQTSQAATPAAADAAISALSAFAEQIGAKSAPAASATAAVSKPDDQAFAALQDFAKRLGTEQPASIKDQTKLADADNLLDWLSQPNHGATPKPEATAPEAKGKTAKRAGKPVEAHFVGDKVCLGCHSSQAAEFQKTLMGRISLTQPGKFSCENCHGPGSAHAAAGGGRGVGGILSFEADDPRTSEEKNAVCLACHEKGDRTNWHGSTHEERGLSCVNCHTIMKSVSRKNQLKTAFEPDTCFQCHKDRRAQMFRSSHMPLKEGKIVCSDCHNPHGSFTEALLKKDSINDTCYTCHAEKRGPFLFEHEPVRENCDNCHDPHGTVNEFSLKLARPRLCFECHSFGHGNTNGPGSNFTMGRSCQNCHTAIHGSNSPAGGALQR
jgi:DmsE family decaheme c-type cytochrome